MKKVFAIVMAVVLMLTLIPGVALAGPDKRGNDLPKAKSYNINIIGVENPRDVSWTGGEGKRIFVLRTGKTTFYVHGGSSFEIGDRNGTDGYVGTGPDPNAGGYVPGLTFPYDGGATPTWRVQIYVRLCGPVDSSFRWTVKYWDGSAYVPYGTPFTVGKSSKFAVKTNQLLADGCQDMLWEWDQKNKFRILQMRIFLLD